MSGGIPITRRRFLRLSTGLAFGTGIFVTGCTSRSPRPGDAGIDAGRDGGTDAGPSDAGPPPRPPNVIVFLVDDMGASDTTDGGSTFYRTPSFARVRREGMDFTQGYSAAPLCSASRAAILTGKYPHRLGITGAIVCAPGCTEIDAPTVPPVAPLWRKMSTPTFRTRIALGETTLAEVLRARGYATAHIGKWHLGGAGYGPLDQGYDINIGGSYAAHAPSYFPPYHLPALTNGPPGEYLTDRLTTEAENFIDAHRAAPFFLSLWHYGVHIPLQAPDTTVADYASRRDVHEAQRNATYAAMLDRMDASLGRVLDKLDALGLSSDTLVVVTSDNGGLMIDNASGRATLVTSNAPHRGGKAHIYDGATRVPFALRWPGRVPAGVADATPVSGIDVVPTVLEAVGVPATVRPRIDGTSLMPIVTGGSLSPARALVWHFPHYIPGPNPAKVLEDDLLPWALPASAIRVGDRKLVRVYGEGATPNEDRFELYDLAHDPGESVDIAASEPTTVAALRAALEANLADTGALIPIPNPNYRPAYDAWRALADCTGRLGSGVLTLTATGPNPLLVGPSVDVATPCQITLNTRSAQSVDYRLYYATAADPTFGAARSIRRTVPAGTAFVDVAFVVRDLGTDRVTALRMIVGSIGTVVEFDAIRINDLASPAVALREWTFSGVDGMPPGGSWFADNDTAVGHSGSGLNVILGGPVPRLVSGYVVLFGPLRVRLRMRSMGSSQGVMSWSTSPTYVDDPMTSVVFDLVHDGAYHDYVVDLPGAGDTAIQRLALRIGDGPGWADVERIAVSQYGAPGESIVAVWEFAG